MNYEIKRGVSLYSYQEGYYTGKMSLEDCIRETAKTGATGIELLAEQMVDEFPVITPEFKEKWFGWMEKYHTEPCCMDAFLENHIFANRTCTLREQIANMERDIRIAHELGFPVLRTLVSTPMPVIEGSLSIAEHYNVKIGLEVHSPFSLNSGWSEGYMEMIQRTGTKYFGFIPDFGIFCKRIPTELTNQALRNGAKPECVKMVQDAFQERVSKGLVKIRYDTNLGAANYDYRVANGQMKLMEQIQKAGGTAVDLNYAGASFNYTWNDPQDIIDNIDYIFHTHAKCYNISEDYEETCIPMQQVIDAYKKAGYHGYLSTEWEGAEMVDDASDSCVEQVRRHQECMRRCIENNDNLK